MDIIYHEDMQMDTDTWSDYQAQALQQLMQFKQAYHRKRQLQDQQQQQLQMFAHSSSPAAQMFAPVSGPLPKALMSSASSSSVPASIPTPATSSTIISQAWLTAGPSHGRPSMSPLDCSTPQDVSLTSYLLNTSVGGWLVVMTITPPFWCPRLQLPQRLYI